MDGGCVLFGVTSWAWSVNVSWVCKYCMSMCWHEMVMWYVFEEATESDRKVQKRKKQQQNNTVIKHVRQNNVHGSEMSQQICPLATMEDRMLYYSSSSTLFIINIIIISVIFIITTTVIITQISKRSSVTIFIQSSTLPQMWRFCGATKI